MYSEPKEIGTILIKNRFVRSATYERRAAKDGSVTDELLQFYKALAEGGVGLINTSFSYIQPIGQAFPNQIAINNDNLVPGLRKLAEIIHENGDGCKAVVQIGHCGRESMFLENTVAPSAVLELMFNSMPKEMTIEEIDETIEAFAQAARRTKEAGFDGVQLHAAHGYLLSGFLSPYTNKRQDKYGGSTENRVRIIENIYERTVDLVGKDFPILIKMNGDDFLENGLTVEESKKIAKMLSKMGFAAIEVSGAMWDVALRTQEELGFLPVFIPESRVDIDSKDKEAYNLPFAKEIKKVIDVPLIMVGGIRSIDVIEKILKEGDADFVALSRPLIREPDLPNKWLKGIGSETCECISCNACLGSTTTGQLRCLQKES